MTESRTGWRFGNESDDPADWAFWPQAWRHSDHGWIEDDFSDHQEAADSYDWSAVFEDGLPCEFVGQVRSPEGEVKRFHVTVEMEPTFWAGEVGA